MTVGNQNTSSSNIVWFSGQVSQVERCKLLNQQPKTIWFTGLSASGKSTLAYALERRLVDMGRACYVLDGDNVRHGLNKGLSFTEQDRSENIRRVAEVAKLMNDAGLIVITSFISPNRHDRDLAKNVIGTEKFLEVYVSTPIAICESRDPKGMYKQARAGKIKEFTGVSAAYEPPASPWLQIDTANSTIAECIDVLVEKLSFNESNQLNA